MIEGEGYFDQVRGPSAHGAEGADDVDSKKGGLMGSENLIVFDDGNELVAYGKDEQLRFQLVLGNPIQEPEAWSSTIVMNTQEELRIAFEEYQNGTFIKHRK